MVDEKKAQQTATAASKIAQSNKEDKDSGIAVGASVAGQMMNGGEAPAGVQSTKKAPGYYSRHAGKVRLGRKVWKWPMEAPLVPKEDEPELKDFLDGMVERGLATKVE